MGGTSSTVKRSISSSSDDVEPSAKRVKTEAPKVVIDALGQIWELEISYASQSPVLQCFIEENESSGSVGENITIDLLIPDPKVTNDGLHQIFSYLCGDDMQLNSQNIEQVLAAAKYLEVENVLENYVAIHVERFSKETILDYYEYTQASKIALFKNEVLDYLLTNFWRFAEDLKFLKDVKRDLFKRLVSDGRLLIPHAEYYIYRLLKTWIMFDQLRICNVYISVSPEIDFSTFISSVNPSFSSSSYYDLIQEIRFTHMLNTQSGIDELIKDKLLPDKIIKDMIADMWMSQLTSTEPTCDTNIDLNTFHESCMRLGYLIMGETSWNWYRIISGVHLEFTYADGKIYATRKFPRGQLIDTAPDFYVFIRGVLCSLDGKVFLDFDPKMVNFKPRQGLLLCIIPDEYRDEKFIFHLMILPISKRNLDTSKYFDEHINSNMVNYA